MSLSLIFVIILTNSSVLYHSLAHAADARAEIFFRTSIKCPEQINTGVLVITDHNQLKNGRRVSFYLESGLLKEVVLDYAQDGTNYVEDIRVNRETFPEDGAWVFNGFAQDAKELMRLFCLADQRSKDRYLLLLEEHRRLLQK